MKKTIVLFISIIFSWHLSHAQRVEIIDSLKNELKSTEQDTSRVMILVNLCTFYRLSYPDSAVFYGNQALSLSKKINFIKGEILSLGFNAVSLVMLGDLPEALRLGLQSIDLAKNTSNVEYSGAALNAVGGVYLRIKDYTRALNYLRQQAAIPSDIEAYIYACYDIGNVFEEMNILDSALFYENQAIKAFRQSKSIEPLVYITIGNIKLKQGDPQAAFTNYQESFQISLKQNEHRAISQSYNKLSQFYKIVNSLDSSIYYAKLGLKEAELSSQKLIILESASLLADLYDSLDAKESLRYYKIAETAKEGLFGSGNIQAIQTMIARDEALQKEIQAAKTQSQNRIRLNALLGGLFTLSIIAFLLFRNSRQNKKAKQNIEKAYAQLKATQSQLIQSEKMASLGELTAGIAHEIQNPLNFVNNFSDVNKELLDELSQELLAGNRQSAEELVKILKENDEKISYHGKRADGIVKSMLQHTLSSSGQKEWTDLNALCDEYLRLAYNAMQARDKSFKVELITEFDPSIHEVNIVPQDIGRVLLNLYNNAFHAVAEKARLNGEDFKPCVSVSSRQSNGRIEISVKDNGIGVPDSIKEKIFQPFFTTKPTGQGTGLGLSLSYDIVKAHRGELKFESTPEEGSSFILHLPQEPGI